jgi:hypothetical protein
MAKTRSYLVKKKKGAVTPSATKTLPAVKANTQTKGMIKKKYRFKLGSSVVEGIGCSISGDVDGRRTVVMVTS